MRSPNLPLTDRHAVARLESLESRQYQAADKPIGINVNDNSAAAFAVAKDQLPKLGVTSVRLWYGVDSWSDRKVEGGLQRAIDYHNAGYDVTMTIAVDDRAVPDPAAVKGWFAWAAGNDALRAAVDRWEIGNEVDQPAYFKGTLKQYVTNWLKPASQALHAEGEDVVSAGVSWNPEDVKEMIGYGMLDMVDAVGFHPYANGVSLQEKRIEQLESVVAGRKPLIATEWNVRGYENNVTQWAAAVDDAYANVRSAFDMEYYYCLFKANTPAGPAGLLTNKGVTNPLFYNGFLAHSNGVGTAPSLPPSTGNSGSTGNTPSQIETQIALYDADTDRVVSGYTNLKANQVIDLADLPGDNLALVVIPAGSAQSVKMTLNGESHTESYKPYAMFGDEGTDLNGRHLSVGGYSFAVTPYSKANGNGTAYATRKINFTITDSRQNTGDDDQTAEVRGFSLVDAKTGKVVKGYERITASTTIALASLSTRSLALLALADEDTRSVKLTADGVTHVENTLPYAVFGDNSGKLATWKPAAGSYSFGAIAYAGKNGSGDTGTGLSLTLKFV